MGDRWDGHWPLIFFGYTSCPDLCPTTLSEIAGALGQLGPLAAQVQNTGRIHVRSQRDRHAGRAGGRHRHALFERRCSRRPRSGAAPGHKIGEATISGGLPGNGATAEMSVDMHQSLELFLACVTYVAPHQPGMRSCAGRDQKCPADETYPNCVNGLPYLRDKDSLPTDSVQFALTKTRSSILDTTDPIPESVHQGIIAQDVE